MLFQRVIYVLVTLTSVTFVEGMNSIRFLHHVHVRACPFWIPTSKRCSLNTRKRVQDWLDDPCSHHFDSLVLVQHTWFPKPGASNVLYSAASFFEILKVTLLCVSIWQWMMFWQGMFSFPCYLGYCLKFMSVTLLLPSTLDVNFSTKIFFWCQIVCHFMKLL
jgi:hypothetical protein